MAHKQAGREETQTSDSEEDIERHSDEQAMQESSSENDSREDKLSCEQAAEETKGGEDLNQYLPLYRAALKGDWESAKKFIEENPNAEIAKITDTSATALHIAVTGGKAMKFVKELVTEYPASLGKVDSMKNTALFCAAAVGNIEVVKFLVEENEDLTQQRSKYGRNTYTPLHMAARNGHKDTVDFLLPKTIYNHPNPFPRKSGYYLLRNLINANLNGIALQLLKDYRDLAHDKDFQSFILPTLAQKPSMFKSGSKLGYWKRLIYRWIPEEEHHLTANSMGGDIENCCATFKSTMGRKVRVRFWNTIKQLVPSIDRIYQTKSTHMQTLELVKHMLKEMTFNQETAPEFLKEPLFRAIELGIHELFMEIIETYPPSAHLLDDEKRNIFQLAVLHRQEKIFIRIYQMGLYKHYIDFKDKQGNNILHLAGKLHPSNQVSGPALQMQQELQWFKAVESLVQPSIQESKTTSINLCTKEEETESSKKPKETKPKSSKKPKEVKIKLSKKTKKENANSSKKTKEEKANSSSSKPSEGLTPGQLFTKAHADLVEKGEKWMKEIASSCSVAATLIVTMVFAAAFTAPGGNNSEGKPIFLRSPPFITFVISDALALFFSTTSVLIFLGILTSRYSEEDFLESLPRKLISALITLFISIVSVMVAFGAVLYIVLSDIFKLVYIPIALLACLPVAVFVWLQFPLLVKVIRSTCRSKILRAVK